jgi:hypothetical protein
MQNAMKNKSATLFDKINEGILKAYEKLVHDKAKEDGELIFCEDGKIIKVKDLLTKQTN